MAAKHKDMTGAWVGNQRFCLGKKLGAGSFGEIYLGVDQRTGDQVSCCCHVVVCQFWTIRIRRNVAPMHCARNCRCTFSPSHL
jgi:hypothetical protein